MSCSFELPSCQFMYKAVVSLLTKTTTVSMCLSCLCILISLKTSHYLHRLCMVTMHPSIYQLYSMLICNRCKTIYRIIHSFILKDPLHLPFVGLPNKNITSSQSLSWKICQAAKKTTTVTFKCLWNNKQ